MTDDHRESSKNFPSSACWWSAMSVSTAGAATTRRWPIRRAKPAFRASAWCPRKSRPGAAGTIANNLAALGAGHVAVLGMVGNDGFGYELRSALAARGISHELLVDAPGVPTFTYTKLINAQTGDEDLPRVDFVYTNALQEPVERELIARLERAASAYDVILVSDQAETSPAAWSRPPCAIPSRASRSLTRKS